MIPSKKTILILLAIAAAVLCTLPLLVKDTLYIKAAQELTANEKQFLKALEKQGIKTVKHNENTPKDAYVLWFYPPEQALTLQNTPTEQTDFIYTDAYYPFEWRGLKKLPVMLTPHQKLYEHYMRSNIKSAVLDIKEPNAAARFAEIYQWLKANR